MQRPINETFISDKGVFTVDQGEYMGQTNPIYIVTNLDKMNKKTVKLN